ncbi:hypothetical protein VPH35_074216 [Triticum aestivum]
MEVTRSDIQTRPYDQPQPPQCEHAAFVKMPFPDPETSHLLEEIWSSRNPSLPPWCEYPSHDVSRPVKTPLLEPKNTNTSSYSTQPEAATHDIVPIPTQSSQHILACFFEGWPIQFFIRLDHGGSFHTYPRLGGPFQSLQEAEDAIDRHLDHLRAPIMHTNGLPQAEIAIRHPFTGLMAQERCPPKAIQSLRLSAYWLKLYWTSTMKITFFLGILHMNLMML